MYKCSKHVLANEMKWQQMYTTHYLKKWFLELKRIENIALQDVTFLCSHCVQSSH